MRTDQKKFGIGIDTEQIARFKKFSNVKSHFLQRVFTESELDYCFSKFDPAQHLAARYAGKEALIKAMNNIRSTNFSDFKSIEILSSKRGLPRARFHGKKLKHFNGYVSLTHDKTRAMGLALVILTFY